MSVSPSIIRPYFYAGALLSTLDAVTTYLAFTLPQVRAEEKNSLMAGVIATVGVTAFAFGKAIVAVVLGWQLARTAVGGRKSLWARRIRLAPWRGPLPQWRVQRSAAWSLAIMVTCTGITVGNNLHALLAPWAAQ